MVNEKYAGFSLPIGDKYQLKLGIACDVGDPLVITGNTLYGRIEVTVFNSTYKSSDIIGVARNKVLADEIHRVVTINISGVDRVRVIEDVKAFDLLMGADNSITELFDGDGSAQQEITLVNTYLASITSVTEDPTGTPTVLAQVPLSVTPTSGQYNVDLQRGIITIGGTSVIGSDNYEVIYDTGEGRYKKATAGSKIITETGVTVTTHIATLQNVPDPILSVNATAGTATGVMKPIYTGTPAAGEVLVEPDLKKLTFATADAVTEATVSYIPENGGAKALCLDTESAGEWVDILHLHRT